MTYTYSSLSKMMMNLAFLITLLLGTVSSFTIRSFVSNPRTTGGLTISTALSMSTRPNPNVKPNGCAKTPYDKKKVAVFGGGGYLGATTFGFLQRAGGLYGTGIGGYTQPRCVCATAAACEALNRILSTNFKLAFAEEDLVALTDMTSVEAISRSVKGMDAVVLGTKYQFERRPVTRGSYETNLNDKAFEFYLEERKLADSVKEDDVAMHISMFRNSMQACQGANVKHVVVVETPRTTPELAASICDIIEEGGIPFTYIRAEGGELDSTQDFTFEKGVQGELNFGCLTIPETNKSDDVGYWLNKFTKGDKGSSSGDDASSSCSTSREDLAAVVVQSLMSLDWNNSRFLNVQTTKKLVDPSLLSSGSGDDYKPYRATAPVRSDRDWFTNSHLLAEKMATLE